MNENVHALHVVAGIIQHDDGTVLLAQRGPECVHAGRWEFPGGKVEPGESGEAALIRELQEELEVTVAVDGFYDEVVHHYAHIAVRLTAYTCRIVSGEGNPVGCADAIWVTPAQFTDYLMPEADQPIAARLAAESA